VESETERIKKLKWGDAQFSGFEWINDGKDLKIHLNHATKPITELTFTWASDLKVSLCWSRPRISSPENPMPRQGHLLTWDVEFHTDDSNRIHVFIDFAHDGSMELECENISSNHHIDAV